MPDRLVSITVAICRPCIAGEGDECHTPGCAYWMQDPPSEAVSQRLRDMLASMRTGRATRGIPEGKNPAVPTGPRPPAPKAPPRPNS